MQLLLSVDCEANHQDFSRNTALHYACNGSFFMLDHVQVVSMLLQKKNVDIKLRNDSNKAPLDLAGSHEVQRLFELYLIESAYESRTSEIPIYSTKINHVKKMFDQSKTLHKTSREQQINEKSSLKVLYPNQEMMKALQQSKQQFTQANCKQSVSFTQSQEYDHSTISDEDKVGPGNFQVLSLLGKGSFGEVYLALRKSTNEQFAMKVLHKTSVQSPVIARAQPDEVRQD